MRFVGERRAIAAAVLSFFMIQLLLSGLLDDGPFRPVLLGLGFAYLVAFLGVVSGWFWARWYTLGLAFSGVVLAAMTGWQNGLIGFVYVLGGSHLAIGLALLGDDAAAFYDGRRDWRDFTTGRVATYAGAGRHIEMVVEEHAAANAATLAAILAGLGAAAPGEG